MEKILANIDYAVKMGIQKGKVKSMSRLSKHHRELTNGVGKCSAPMFSGGCPHGFCDDRAYGERPESPMIYSAAHQRMVRTDNKYDGYVPGLACPGHGGPKLTDNPHHDDPCRKCGTPHDEVESGLCRG